MHKWLILLLAVLLSACSDHGTNGGAEPDRTANEVIDKHGSIENLGALDTFVQKASNDEPSSVRIVQYTIEGDPIYHDLTVSDQKITLRYDTTEDKFGSGKITTYECEELARTETGTLLAYTLKGCSGGNKERAVLRVPFDLQAQDYFGFVLKYGVGERNEVNTIDRILAKDLQNGKRATIDGFQLTADELQRIYKTLVLANYLSEKRLTTECNRKPHQSYYLKVKINGADREYRWSECDGGQDGIAMTEVSKAIIDVVSNRDDYKKLPDVQGSYL
ncbi:DUF4362 domain-containing protein [Cohnella faecalis]|uniref:DUF4362 domain-containing protein n=1 Tax=Cohnella faecalis TaxID=2315694 RepID=UPI0036069EC9